MAKAQNKTIENEASVDDFMSSIQDDNKRSDCLQIKKWMEEITGEPAKMWGTSIVGFGNYHYKYESGREGDFMKVGFSPRAQNITLYIMPGFERYPDLMEKLGKHKIGKSCLYVKKLEDIDTEILKDLITESFSFMSEKYG